MTFEEYLLKETHRESQNKRGYKSLIDLCICFDVDWINESYEECEEKVSLSTTMLSLELEAMQDRVAANLLFKERTAKLPKR